MPAIIALLNISMQVPRPNNKKRKTKTRKQESLLENKGKKLLFGDDDIKNLQTNVEN